MIHDQEKDMAVRLQVYRLDAAGTAIEEREFTDPTLFVHWLRDAHALGVWDEGKHQIQVVREDGFIICIAMFTRLDMWQIIREVLKYVRVAA